MKLVGSREQNVQDFKFDASGTIGTGGTAQLVLPRRSACSMLLVQNVSSAGLMLEFGSARATCTISGGKVNAITVTNAGFGFTLPPNVIFFGGGNNLGPGNAPNSLFVGAGIYGYPSPSRPAIAHCVMTGSAPNLSVASITIDDPGAGYVCAPQVFLHNDILDPNGCAVPSATAGLLLAANGGSYYVNGTACTTDPIAIYGANTGQAFTCKWMS